MKAKFKHTFLNHAKLALLGKRMGAEGSSIFVFIVQFSDVWMKIQLNSLG